MSVAAHIVVIIDMDTTGDPDEIVNVYSELSAGLIRHKEKYPGTNFKMTPAGVLQEPEEI